MSQEFFSNLVLLLLLVPTVGAVCVALAGPGALVLIRRVSMTATLITLLFAVVLAIGLASYPAEHEPLAPANAVPTFHPRFATAWDVLTLGKVKGEAIQFFVGIDGLNIWLILLTALLTFSAVLISWDDIKERANEYYAWLLILETGMLGVFLSFDIIVFYVFFELTLVPLFFLIGIWGGPQRRYAARKFFIYTLAGSLITLLGILAIVLVCYNDENIHKPLTFSIPDLITLVNERLAYLRQNPAGFAGDLAYWQTVEFWVFLALMAGFAIKVPLVPFHTWLPLAHVEAPTAGSVLLAGVLLKIGAYGFLRLCLPLVPDASVSIGVPLIGALAVIGIVYGALCALAQDDIKKLVAYSSVSHLGFCMLGLFALNEAGLSGGLLQMINHGLSTGALFLLVGMLYERYHTRLLGDYGGMAARLKLLACAMVFFCLSSIGLPGLNGFVGEVLILMGIWDAEYAQGLAPVLAVVGATGIVLGAWYLLTMLQLVFFGPLKEPHAHPEGSSRGQARDLTGREWAALVPIAIWCLLLGILPQPFLRVARADLGVVAALVGRAQEPDLVAHQRLVVPTPVLAGKASREKPLSD
jgi:NADH-quinone oxidoreductase subunit M